MSNTFYEKIYKIILTISVFYDIILKQSVSAVFVNIWSGSSAG